VIVDDEGGDVELDAAEAAALLQLTNGLEPATVSACPDCRSRVIACVALVDLLEAAPPHPRSGELMELAEDAPTLHLYVRDEASLCVHPSWRDPGAVEWAEVMADIGEDVRGPR
jgi:hypothetical protein